MVLHMYIILLNKVIEEHDKSSPLFLYLAHQAVHSGQSFSTWVTLLYTQVSFFLAHQVVR